jgi:hypothetical protein
MKGRDTAIITVYSPEGDECRIEVAYDWWNDPGVMYYPDGSGCPPDSGSEINGYCLEGGGEVPDWVTDDLVQEAFDEADIEYPLYEEPDFDL